jgi:nucleoside-diphosphate-sugar epimerase
MQLAGACRPIIGCAFGDDAFLSLLTDSRPFDVLCHHAADVTNYRSADFDVTAAVGNNTRSIAKVLTAMKSTGASRLVLTGSFFENDEGAGSGDLGAFNPYGLSKALTYQMFRHYCSAADMSLGKFVIPNPFGPWEEPRFTAYLMKNFFAKTPASVNTPAYVRDNIPVSLLAGAYVRFVESMPATPGLRKLNPSGYVESQGAFALRFASEMRARLNLPCEVILKEQTEFTEPRMRLNTDPVADSSWSESKAWDEVAAFYESRRQP